MSDNQISPDRSRIAARQLSAEEAAQIQAQFFTQVYGWMAAGLALTGGSPVCGRLARRAGRHLR
ncbi:MAG: hypothetical protein WKG07_42860 [Hymenobacter sp.]